MIHYRLYTFDGAHRIVSGRWLSARCDDEAVAKVMRSGSGACELWQRDRLVWRLFTSSAYGP